MHESESRVVNVIVKCRERMELNSLNHNFSFNCNFIHEHWFHSYTRTLFFGRKKTLLFFNDSVIKRYLLSNSEILRFSQEKKFPNPYPWVPNGAYFPGFKQKILIFILKVKYANQFKKHLLCTKR